MEKYIKKRKRKETLLILSPSLSSSVTWNEQKSSEKKSLFVFTEKSIRVRSARSEGGK
jgi:hypothetical protein